MHGAVKIMSICNLLSLALISILSPSGLVYAEEASPFTLGIIQVRAGSNEAGEVGTRTSSSRVSREDMKLQNRHDVGDAINLLPGVILSTNARNEKLISVRGYDSRQVPVFIDGIPVYVPYDGYVDFARFSTGDLSFIQVDKGYTSVAYGPNTLGGAINLISRKPVGKLEGDLNLGSGSGNERRLAANLGTNQGFWYLQSGIAYDKADYFPMSKQYKPSASEDGGRRNNSYREDLKYSVKVGVTPNKSDEYAISFYQQHGKKGQPPSTDSSKARYWQWPYWDKQSVYFVSQKAIGEVEFLKIRLYHDRFDNEVNSFTDGTYWILKTSGAGSIGTGKNVYHDRTNGASIAFDSFRFVKHEVTAVIQIKDDVHRELDAANTEVTRFSDRLLHFGVEDSFAVADRWTWLLGVSHSIMAPQSVFSLGNNYQLPNDKSSSDWQTALVFREESNVKWHISLAQKTRMPTLKDRYSQRLGTYLQNSDLRSERALNFELGQSREIAHSLMIDAALFWNEITDKIQSVANVQGPLSQMQNVDRSRIYGGEVGLRGDLSASFSFQANYTYLHAQSRRDQDVRITDLPQHKVFASVIFRPWQVIEIVPTVEHNSDRWVSNVRSLGAWTVFGLKTGYRFKANSVFEVGATNLGDSQYALADGFPNPGRMYFANLSLSL
jgi:iron complex outermembrane recepter protein